MESDYVTKEINLKISDSKNISVIHSISEILEEDYQEDKVRILYRASSANDKYIESLLGLK
ncbi:MAG: hypothetical protein U0354_15845 [Candidatus Sericytochromatia bacterium]